MGGSRWRGRINRLRKRATPERYSPHGWGQSPEDIRDKICAFPRQIAERAVELQKLHDQGEELPDPLKGSGLEMQAHVLAVYSRDGPDAVPQSWIHSLDRRNALYPEPFREKVVEIASLIMAGAESEYRKLQGNQESEEAWASRIKR